MGFWHEDELGGSPPAVDPVLELRRHVSAEHLEVLEEHLEAMVALMHRRFQRGPWLPRPVVTDEARTAARKRVLSLATSLGLRDAIRNSVDAYRAASRLLRNGSDREVGASERDAVVAIVMWRVGDRADLRVLWGSFEPRSPRDEPLETVSPGDALVEMFLDRILSLSRDEMGRLVELGAHDKNRRWRARYQVAHDLAVDSTNALAADASRILALGAVRRSCSPELADDVSEVISDVALGLVAEARLGTSAAITTLAEPWRVLCSEIHEPSSPR